MYEADRLSGVSIHVYALGPPGLIRLVAGCLWREGVHLEEIEGDTVVPRHRKNGAAVAFELRQARLLESLPGLGRFVVEGDCGTACAPAAGSWSLRSQLPAECVARGSGRGCSSGWRRLRWHS